MNVQTKLLCLLSTILISGCATAQRPEFTVRPHAKSPAVNNSASFAKGRQMLAQREYGLAIDSFRLVLRNDPGNAAAHNAIAVAYDALGRPDLARQNFELALGFAPAKEKFYRNFARHLKAQGEDQLAETLRRDFQLARHLQMSAPDLGATSVTAVEIANISSFANSVDSPAAPRKLLDDAAPQNPKPLNPDDRDVPAQRHAILIREPAISQEHNSIRQSGLGHGDDRGERTGFKGSGRVREQLLNPQDRLTSNMENLDKTLAGLYRGIGRPLFSNSGSRSVATSGSNQLPGNAKPRKIERQAFETLIADLRRLSQKEYLSFKTKTESERPAYTSSMYNRPANIRNGPHLLRVSLGEVALVTKPVSRTYEQRFKAFERDMLSERKPTGLPGKLAFSITLTALLQPENVPVVPKVRNKRRELYAKIDAAMADLVSRRNKRALNMVHRPSEKMQSIAAWLYQQVDPEAGLAYRTSFPGKALAHENLQISNLTMQYRSKQECFI